MLNTVCVCVCVCVWIVCVCVCGYLFSVVLDGHTEDALCLVASDLVHLSIKPGVLEGNTHRRHTSISPCHHHVKNQRTFVPSTTIHLEHMSNTTNAKENKKTEKDTSVNAVIRKRLPKHL